jgi:hypothetical protein
MQVALRRRAAHNGGAQLLGGPGSGPLILAQLGGQDICNFPHASRVSCSELLGGISMGLRRGIVLNGKGCLDPYRF